MRRFLLHLSPALAGVLLFLVAFLIDDPSPAILGLVLMPAAAILAVGALVRAVRLRSLAWLLCFLLSAAPPAWVVHEFQEAEPPHG